MSKKFKQVLALLGCVLVGAFVVAGCGSDDSSGDSGGSADSGVVADAQTAADQAAQIPTEILQTESYTPKPKGFIYHVACDQSLEGCADKAKSLKSAVEALGYKFELCDGGSTPDRIAGCFTNAINAKPDVIVTNGIAATDAGDSYTKVAESGIPHIGMFTGNPPGKVDGVLTEVGGDSCGAGATDLANWVIADSDGKANVLFVGTNTFACNVQRMDAFTKQMETCDTCNVDTLKFSIDSIQSTLPQQIQAELQSNPDIDYVVGTFDAVALAAADVVRQAGKSDSIKVAGFDGDGPNLELIQQGDIQAADVATGGLEPGWVAADAAARVIAGQKLEPNTPVTRVLINDSNAAEIGGSYDGPAGFEDQFKALWGN
ncbi:MAG: substrate-binding domain-containing protein [Solirubrobacterales bacterium]|nr:substrate-binding domain-containing protein [Solirubrobacterales bacterium]